MEFKAIADKDRLDVLLANMNELQITNMIEILDTYITIRSLWEIERRMLDSEASDYQHEFKMRWILDFRDMISELLKKD